MVKNWSCNAGNASSIPGRGTKILHVAEQLSPRTTTREKPAHHNERSRMLQLRRDTSKKIIIIIKASFVPATFILAQSGATFFS